jgi:hypothetical protein
MQLSEIIPWGRSFDEYRLMFGLSETDLAGRILGCGDGPASFNAEATALGYSVISCDPIYEFSTEEIKQRAEHSYVTVMSQLQLHLDGFLWHYFQSPNLLGQARMAAMRLFLEDFELLAFGRGSLPQPAESIDCGRRHTDSKPKNGCPGVFELDDRCHHIALDFGVLLQEHIRVARCSHDGGIASIRP